jgi:hypothetical protein
MKLRGISAALCLLGTCARADVTFTVSFDDPSNLLNGYRNRLRSHLLAAGAIWAERLPGNAVLSIRVRPTAATSSSSGYSFTSSFVNTLNGINVFEQGAAAHIRTGQNVAPGNPDIEFIINPSYMTDELWFDPSPSRRTAAPDLTRTDAMSVCLHELGHALAYNGWMDGFTGGLPGNYMSTFDRHVTFDGESFWFEGPRAVGVYGGPVPVTYGNPFHIGNAGPRPGEDLIPQLMNGVVFEWGRRYWISELDWAILADAGIAVLPPPCAADFNGDGFVDFFDFDDFVLAFEAGDPAADFNFDGFIDFFDFDDFVLAFETGC